MRQGTLPPRNGMFCVLVYTGGYVPSGVAGSNPTGTIRLQAEKRNEVKEMAKPKINMITIEADSYMEARNAVPEKMKPVVEAEASMRYGKILRKATDEIPFEDMPFWINEMRILLAAIEQVEPETYAKALDMFPEKKLRESASEIAKKKKRNQSAISIGKYGEKDD